MELPSLITVTRLFSAVEYTSAPTAANVFTVLSEISEAFDEITAVDGCTNSKKLIKFSIVRP